MSAREAERLRGATATGLRRAVWSGVVAGLALLFLALSLALPLVSEGQIIRPFTPRFTANAPGDIVIVGNTVLTCEPSNDCEDAQQGQGNDVDNNDHQMIYVDVDGRPSTFNSSSADLNLPGGSTVVWGGLYWFGTGLEDAPERSARDLVNFQTPAVGAYLGITASQVDDFPGTAAGDFYSAFADVTELVQAGGNGTYMVGNVQSGLDDNRAAGWALVVVYTNPAGTLRNLTVFDGLGNVTDDISIHTSVSGFVTPPAGNFTVRLGAVTAEGDRGLTGDSFRLNDSPLANPTNPASNFFNSSISLDGVDVTSRNPSFSNTLGFDADIGEAQGGPGGLIENGATSATASFTSDGDQYLPMVLTFAVQIFQPIIDPAKTVTDLNGPILLPGDVLEYTISMTNTGNDPATGVVLSDPVPANTTYVPGSLEILSGPGAGAKTDAAGDDEAEFNAGTGQVVFRLGTGADATEGGTLGIGAATSLRFQVTVNPGTPALTTIENQASVEFASETTEEPFEVLTDGDPQVPGDQPTQITVLGTADVALTKSAAPDPVPAGGVILYTLTATNLGPARALFVTIAETLPPGTTFQGAITSAGGVCLTPPAGQTGNIACSWPGLTEVGAARTVRLLLKVDPAFSGSTLSNTAAAANLTPDPDPSNNTSDSTVNVVTAADLRVSKTAFPLARPGGNVSHALTVTNAGPSPAQGVVLQDPVPAGLTFVSATAPCAAGFPCPIGAMAPGATVSVVATYQVSPTTGPGQIVNTATVSSPTPDPVPANNTASASTLIVVLPSLQTADLALAKTASPSLVRVGESLTYTLTATNLGPDAATDVTIQDPLPAGTTFVSAAPSAGGNCTTPAVGAAGTVTCVWPGPTAVGAAAARTLTLVVATVAGGGSPVLNLALASSASDDPVLANNAASAPAAVIPDVALGTDIAVAKVLFVGAPGGGQTTVVPGSFVTFWVKVMNVGPLPGFGIQVSDVLPPELLYVSSVPSQGTYDPVTGVWAVGALPVGGMAVLDVTAQAIGEGPVQNTARRLASQPPDVNIANDVSTAALVIQAVFGGGVFVAVGKTDGIVGAEIVTGAAVGGGPHVRAFDLFGTPLGPGFFAYDPRFTGGVRVASGGDFDQPPDGMGEIVTGAGLGGGPHVRVIKVDADGNPVGDLASFFAYDPAFTGGVFVAAGDVNNDGIPDVVTGADAGGGPHVRVFSGAAFPALVDLASFLAYDPAFSGGVRVALGDVNGDGVTDIVTAAGPGGGPHVRVFSGAALPGLVELAGFFAYDPAFTGGVFVAAGDVDGDGVADVVTGADAGGGPHVRVFSGAALPALVELAGFFAYSPTFTGGVRIAVGDVNGDGIAEILTTPGLSSDPHVRAFTMDGADVNGGGFFAY